MDTIRIDPKKTLLKLNKIDSIQEQQPKKIGKPASLTPKKILLRVSCDWKKSSTSSYSHLGQTLNSYLNY